MVISSHGVKPAWWDEATRTLARRDRVLRRLIRAHPDVHLVRRSDAFTTLARAIVGQQISVRAAETIWRRLIVASAPGAAGQAFPVLAPAAVMNTPTGALRACGLSQRKCEYLCDLAGQFERGGLDPRAWPSLDDEALITALVGVKGIGRWTAEMYLIFHECRGDILPLADIGLQKAVARHYFGDERPDDDAIGRLARTWQPWRSVATWYLWRSLDPIPVEY